VNDNEAPEEGADEILPSDIVALRKRLMQEIHPERDFGSFIKIAIHNVFTEFFTHKKIKTDPRHLSQINEDEIVKRDMGFKHTVDDFFSGKGDIHE
jgi:hypothetical protein